jgi:hypothetical protein
VTLTWCCTNCGPEGAITHADEEHGEERARSEIAHGSVSFWTRQIRRFLRAISPVLNSVSRPGTVSPTRSQHNRRFLRKVDASILARSMH